MMTSCSVKVWRAFWHARNSTWWGRPATAPNCWSWSARTSPTWRSWTCGCHRPAPPKGCRRPRRSAGSSPVAILVLSAYVEVEHALELLSSGDRIGYLLKTRVTDVAELIDALERIAKGGSVIDPFLVQRLFAAHRRGDPLAKLSAREREVLALMAEGRSNAGIVHKLWITEPTVEKHVHSILTKLCLPETNADHRRVLAVLAFLNAS